MRRPCTSLGAVGLLLVATSGPASAQVGDPVEAYHAVVAVTRQATSWEPILPLLSPEYRRDVKRKDAEGQQALLSSFKSALAHTDFVITRRRKLPGEVELEATARNALGQPIRGEIDMELVHGVWKLDEFHWKPVE